MKKILTEKDKGKNVVVEVHMWGGDDIKYPREKYKCVGVLMKDEPEMIRVAFNAIKNKVKDALDIPRKDVISIRRIKKSEIKVLD